MSIYMSLEVRLTGTCWEGWVTMPNWEAGEVNTLGCCFYWTFPPGSVVTASPSLKMYDGTACTFYWKKPSNWPKGAQTLLFAFFNINFPFLLLFGPHLSQPPAWPGMNWVVNVNWNRLPLATHMTVRYFGPDRDWQRWTPQPSQLSLQSPMLTL